MRKQKFIFAIALILMCLIVTTFGQGGTGKTPTKTPAKPKPKAVAAVKPKVAVTKPVVKPKPKPQPPKPVIIVKQTPKRQPPQTTFRASAPNIEMVKIPAGSFTMGDDNSSESDEKPAHQVRITEGFYMGKYEVTQAQWKAVMGNNPSRFNGCGDDCPVEEVSWDDAQAFIRKLNDLQSDYVYRLPTEAEWEYACRAGTTTAFSFGDSLSSSQANFDGNYPYGGAAKGRDLEKTTSVGSYSANDFGLYDMHGNVWEWCEDWYGAYQSGSATDPRGASSGSYRVFRGGGWSRDAANLRSAYRNDSPWYSNASVGLRLVRIAL